MPMFKFLKRKQQSRPEGIFLTPEAHEAIKSILAMWSEEISKMPKEMIFDKICELMEEQRKRLNQKMDSIQKRMESDDDHYDELDEAIVEVQDWEMMYQDVLITLGRVDRET